MKYILILLISTSFLFAQKFYYEYGKKVEIVESAQSKALSSAEDVQEYETKDGKIVKFKMK